MNATIGQAPMTVAVAGSTGFIGSAVVDELVRMGHRVQALRRHSSKASPEVEEIVAQDGVADLRALDRLLTGSDVLVHAVSYTGEDEELQRTTNISATRTLCEQAAEHSIRRIVHISTAGVYGTAFAPGIDESTPPVPRSTLSQCRMEAERIVIDAGGIALRPQFVLGAGDTWVLSRLSALIRACGAQGVKSGAHASVIGRSSLARVVGIVAAGSAQHQIYNVGTAVPVSMGDLVEQVLTGKGEFREAPRRVSVDDVLIAADKLGVPRRAVALALEESVLNCSRLWTEFPETSRPAEILSANDIAWYRRWLGITN